LHCQATIFAAMSEFAHDSIVPNENSQLSKKEQVAGMFDRIAFRYDFLNRFLSAGIDKIWRRKALKELSELQPKNLLDVATGTADVALMAARQLKVPKIVGIDISEGMLRIGRQKIVKAGLEAQIELQSGDSEAIKHPDNSFESITVAFGVRNFEHLEKGLAEILRVLKPGGKLVVLEFSRPKQTGFKQFYQLYMKMVAPRFSQMLGSDKEAYAYLNNSVMHFPERENFEQVMQSVGFKKTYYKSLSLGICCIYCGSK
jgi:demethylmenaquinone methyltransferase / 2-methoxy-6-polyprenyl-1,4-benzoquinol methylase